MTAALNFWPCNFGCPISAVPVYLRGFWVVLSLCKGVLLRFLAELVAGTEDVPVEDLAKAKVLRSAQRSGQGRKGVLPRHRGGGRAAPDPRSDSQEKSRFAFSSWST